MLRPNRAYKKGAPHRDARLFVIVAEGDREDLYFSFFNEINSRILIKKVPRKEGNSSPKFFLDRVSTFIDSGEWSQNERDELWFICDVDKWERRHIDELFHACADKTNWNLAISNPCFEVWLYFHSSPNLTNNGQTCLNLKTLLPTTKVGQFNVNTYCPLIESACENAKHADNNPNHYFPERMQTKLYRLAKNMIELLGKNWK